MKFRLILPLLLCASTVAAQERDRFQLEVFQWEPDATGFVQVLEAGIGSDIDLERDLGITSDSVTGIRLSLFPSQRTEVRFGLLPISFSGDLVANQTITFGGQTFEISERIVSALDLDYLRAGFAWQFLSSGDGRFRAGPLVEVKAFDGSASLTAPDLLIPITVSETFEAAFGSAGIAVDLEPTDRVHVFGEYTALVASDEGDQSDFEVGVQVRIWEALYAFAGVRTMEIQFEDGDDFIDFELDAAFFGVALRL